MCLCSSRPFYLKEPRNLEDSYWTQWLDLQYKRSSTSHSSLWRATHRGQDLLFSKPEKLLHACCFLSYIILLYTILACIPPYHMVCQPIRWMINSPLHSFVLVWPVYGPESAYIHTHETLRPTSDPSDTSDPDSALTRRWLALVNRRTAKHGLLFSFNRLWSTDCGHLSTAEAFSNWSPSLTGAVGAWVSDPDVSWVDIQSFGGDTEGKDSACLSESL